MLIRFVVIVALSRVRGARLARFQSLRKTTEALVTCGRVDRRLFEWWRGEEESSFAQPKFYRHRIPPFSRTSPFTLPAQTARYHQLIGLSITAFSSFHPLPADRGEGLRPLTALGCWVNRCDSHYCLCDSLFINSATYRR